MVETQRAQTQPRPQTRARERPRHRHWARTWEWAILTYASLTHIVYFVSMYAVELT